jgi:phage terminase small subunit
MNAKPKPFMELYDALDPKEQAFVDEYIESLNATLAARRVWGVQAAKQKGYALLHRADVAATIAAGLREQNERTNNDPDRIIRELMLARVRGSARPDR